MYFTYKLEKICLYQVEESSPKSKNTKTTLCCFTEPTLRVPREFYIRDLKIPLRGILEAGCTWPSAERLLWLAQSLNRIKVQLAKRWPWLNFEQKNQVFVRKRSSPKRCKPELLSMDDGRESTRKSAKFLPKTPASVARHPITLLMKKEDYTGSTGV